MVVLHRRLDQAQADKVASLRPDDGAAANEDAGTASPDMHAQLLGALRQRDQAVGALWEMNRQIVAARTRPWNLIADKIRYRVLKALSERSPPVSPRLAAKFARSAAKRAPDREMLRDGWMAALFAEAGLTGGGGTRGE